MHVQRALRVLIVTPITAPYRVPVFGALARRSDLRLRVVYLAERDPSRSWPPEFERMEYDYRVLREWKALRVGSSWLHLSTGLVGELWRHRRGVVIVGGWDQPLHHLARLLRPFFRYSLVCWVESNARDQRGGSRLLDAVKRSFLAACRAVIVPGDASEAYVRALGVQPEAIHRAPNAVDNDRFSRAAVDRSARGQAPRILYVGRLHPIKGIDVLLRAWQGAPREEAILAIAGDGPLVDDVSALARRRGDVQLLGHLDGDDLLQAYADADVFVLPSLSDPWGLVINEAMAAGLPVVTTSIPGAVDDLVVHGENGLIVAPGDPDQLREALLALIREPATRLRMGAAGRGRIQSYSPQRCADGIAEAAIAAADASLRRASATARRD
jgi:glycosyltransferase involved in cell wall biosynthesis